MRHSSLPVARSHAITPPSARLNTPTAMPSPTAIADGDWLSRPSETGSTEPLRGAFAHRDRRDRALVAGEHVAGIGDRAGIDDRGLDHADAELVSPALGAGHRASRPSTTPPICVAITASPTTATMPRAGSSIGWAPAQGAGDEIERDDAAALPVGEDRSR